MYKISKEFSFCASHILMGLPKGHPCSSLHGHNYTVIFTFQSKELDEVGMIIDYRSLDIIKQFINTKFDHKHLNDVIAANPTAENIAKYFYDNFKETFYQLYSVEVKETLKTSAIYIK